MNTIQIWKLGGKILEDASTLDELLKKVSDSKDPIILVHGGGIIANQLAAKLGEPVVMHQGRRITTPGMLEIAIMSYAGKINKSISTALSSMGRPSLGLCGGDLNIITGHKRVAADVDFGMVGDIDNVNITPLTQALDMGWVPVIAPLIGDGEGGLLNTNADTIACRLGTELQMAGFATQICLTMDLEGVRMVPSDESTLVPKIDRDRYDDMKKAQIVSGGMLPKLDMAFSAKTMGVSRVFICHPKALSTDTSLLPKPATEII
ncbi:MAG: acetylglutamate kinase [Pseudobacteriovorax sp.]|nr:acetylglutamate kinase [Pseudobacteriovorax sp.]